LAVGAIVVCVAAVQLLSAATKWRKMHQKQQQQWE